MHRATLKNKKLDFLKDFKGEGPQVFPKIFWIFKINCAHPNTFQVKLQIWPEVSFVKMSFFKGATTWKLSKLT